MASEKKKIFLIWPIFSCTNCEKNWDDRAKCKKITWLVANLISCKAKKNQSFRRKNQGQPINEQIVIRLFNAPGYRQRKGEYLKGNGDHGLFSENHINLHMWFYIGMIYYLMWLIALSCNNKLVNIAFS